MPSDAVLLGRDNRQWVLSTAIRFSGTDLTTAADSTNSVLIKVRPGTLFLRGTLVVLTSDGDEAVLRVGVSGNLDQLSGGTSLDAVEGIYPFMHWYDPTAGAAASVYSDPTAGTVLYYPEATDVYVTYSDAGAQDGEYIIALEYVIVDRANEVYG